MILNFQSFATFLNAAAPVWSFPASPLRTAGGADTNPGTAASSVHETIAIGGSSSTAISIMGNVDDPE